MGDRDQVVHCILRLAAGGLIDRGGGQTEENIVPVGNLGQEFGSADHAGSTADVDDHSIDA